MVRIVFSLLSALLAVGLVQWVLVAGITVTAAYLVGSEAAQHVSYQFEVIDAALKNLDY